jgi:hypothetical protein
MNLKPLILVGYREANFRDFLWFRTLGDEMLDNFATGEKSLGFLTLAKILSTRWTQPEMWEMVKVANPCKLLSFKQRLKELKGI